MIHDAADGVVCLEHGTSKWIMMTGDDERMCDNKKDCRKGWDENCLQTTSKT